MSRYPALGNRPIVPAADLLNLQSRANVGGDSRVQSGGVGSLGKRAGTEVIRDSSGTYSVVIAKGPKSSDGWFVADGSATYLPVNIVDASWTDSAGCTYVAGLLTADGVDNPTATQVVALKAGKYRVVGEVNRHAAGDVPKLAVVGATDGAVLTKEYQTAVISANDSAKSVLNETFSIAVDQNVTFNLSIINAAGALEAGAAYILINLEAANN